ncbi:hypothetical protein EXT60_05835 [Pectobacterium carotovorum subsp. carotovorum]|jgi:hypothetical protein|nr:hypothetical protein [Pectobacterium carotovorum]MCL6363757.1 hypothetical protein [Pectobacterium carotovorum subsp. carotovorum]
MSDMTISKAAVKACQLSSLISVINGGEISETERCNLMDLANELSGEVAVFLLDKDSEVQHA